MVITSPYLAKAKQYFALIAAFMSGGLLTSGVAYVMQGRTFGFSNATFSIPAFLVGSIAALIITLLALKIRSNHQERITTEQRYSTELKSEIAEHERTEEALRASEERYRGLVEMSPDGILVHTDGTIMFCNSALAKILRVDGAENIVGRQTIEFIPEHDRAAVLERRREAALHLPATFRETNYLCADGAIIDVDRYITQISWQGTPSFLVVARDISDRKRAEAAERNSEQRFRELIENFPFPIQIMGMDSSREYVNQAFLDLLGFRSKDEVYALPQVANFVEPYERERIEGYRLARERGEPVPSNYEYDVRRTDGVVIPVQVFTHTIHWRGKPAHQRVYLDLTERKRAENALGSSEQELLKAQSRLIDAIDSLPVAFNLFDSENRLIRSNAQQEAITNTSELHPAMEPGRRFEDIARETAYSKRLVGALGREEEWLRERIACFNNPQGSMEVNYTDGRCIQIINRKTSEGGTVGIRIDITEQRKHEEKLHQAQKMEAVGQLTGGVAHDFNNLLTVVQGNLELLSDRVKADDTAQKFVERALSSAQRGATLTARLLAFSRQQALVPKPIAALDLIHGMTDLLRRTLEESVEIEFVGEEDLWRCKADPGQLENAILNLAINARDAMSGSGKLTIETANVELDDDYAAAQAEVAAGQYVMIAVTDTGTGMEQEVIDKVFDPFFTTKDVGKGSGLGLSMVYGFVKQSGGYVTIYSEEGIGTTVKLYMPRFEGVGEENEQPETVATPEANGETILVVEDDPDVRTMTVALLKDIGYEIIEASDAESALKMLATSSRINMLFTDVVLPGDMNGPKLAAEIRRLRPGIAVLYTSGYTENAIVHQGQVDEGTDLLNKPFSRSDLARKIRTVLDKSMS